MAAVVGSPSDPFLELLPTTAAVVRAEEGMVVASPSDPFLQQSASASQIFFLAVNFIFFYLQPVLRIRIPGPNFSIPDSPVKKVLDPGSATKILSIFNTKNCCKALNPGFETATLASTRP
jgi:hypothetical protein